MRLGQIILKLRAFASFLGIPIAVVLLFLALAIATYQVDSAISKDMVKESSALEFLEGLFGDRGATRTLLATLASALITVTSITFSLLLLAVQQGAASLSNQILDQFLQRRANQFYFGFFVGLSLFTLLALATTRDLHHPIFGTVLAISLTIVALCMMLVLIYTTIGQMRSGEVIGAIAAMTKTARRKDVAILRKTSAGPARESAPKLCCRADRAGTVLNVNVEAVADALAKAVIDGQAVVRATKGSYVARGDPLVEIRSTGQLDRKDAERLEQSVRCAFDVGSGRPVKETAVIGIHQLATIAWISASSARSNPQPAVITCRALTDLAWEWTVEECERDHESRVVYPDEAVQRCLSALESIAVAATESMQHQTLAEVYDSYARLLDRVSGPVRKQIERAVMLSLSGIEDHVPTTRLLDALDGLACALRNAGSGVANELERVVRKREVPAREAAQAQQ